MNRSIQDIIPGQVRKLFNVVPTKICNQVLDYINWNKGQLTFCHLYSCEGYTNLELSIFDLLWTYIKKVIPQTYNGSKIDKLDEESIKLNICEPSKTYKIFNMVTQDNKDTNNILYAYFYLNHDFEGGFTRILNDSNGKYYDIIADKGSLVFINKAIYRKETIITDGPKYFITFQVKYENNINIISNNTGNNNKQIIKVSEIGAKDRFSHVPSGNGLKYKQAQILYNDSVMMLVANKDDNFSQYRWNEVKFRPRIYEIEKVNVDSYIDTFQGRPPTDYEDYCPNCYEILPIVTDYQNCSGCCSPVIKTNQELRKKILSGR